MAILELTVNFLKTNPRLYFMYLHYKFYQDLSSSYNSDKIDRHTKCQFIEVKTGPSSTSLGQLEII